MHFVHQNKNKNNEVEHTEVNNDEPQHQIDEADKEMDAVEAFKVCHTSSKKGMGAVARDTVVSPFCKTFILLCPTLSVHDASYIANVHGCPLFWKCVILTIFSSSYPIRLCS
jgi:hypothetical protein